MNGMSYCGLILITARSASSTAGARWSTTSSRVYANHAVPAREDEALRAQRCRMFPSR